MTSNINHKLQSIVESLYDEGTPFKDLPYLPKNLILREQDWATPGVYLSTPIQEFRAIAFLRSSHFDFLLENIFCNIFNYIPPITRIEHGFKGVDLYQRFIKEVPYFKVDGWFYLTPCPGGKEYSFHFEVEDNRINQTLVNKIIGFIDRDWEKLFNKNYNIDIEEINKYYVGCKIKDYSKNWKVMKVCEYPQKVFL